MVRRCLTPTAAALSSAVEIKIVARALEAGTYGQSVRVRNEATRDIFQVTMTAHQEATMGPGDGPEPAALAGAADAAAEVLTGN